MVCASLCCGHTCLLTPLWNLSVYYARQESVVVYYCIADFAQLTPYASELERGEKAIVELSDLVFSNSEHLAEHCERWTNKVHVFPPGLNLREFPVESTGQPCSVVDGPDFSSDGVEKKHPVIGYVGGIHRHMAIEMLSTMARSRPDWRWVFVRPNQDSARDL